MNSRSLRRRPARWLTLLLTPVLCLLVALKALDLIYPLRAPAAVSSLVLASDGTPLRAFQGRDEQWRYPVDLAQVSPAYLQLLLTYEDRWFYQHPGVNPLALLRALWQNTGAQRVVSGGSTLTMQVARLLYPHPRTLRGKVSQMLRALQLEWHYSKDHILSLYLNLAPFGGTLSGVQAASYFYFGKPASDLSDAEAALLAVLPQRPSDYRPDRHPARAQAARDKVLTRMVQLGVWASERVQEARQEPLDLYATGVPLVAPHLSRRLHKACDQCEQIPTYIDYELQVQLEQMAKAQAERLSDDHSVALMVMDNRDGRVRAYVGSSDFWAEQRAGQVDMVTAIRSPGSTLKPFLYGLALDDGLIHSHSLLIDAPRMRSEYRPGNFERVFSGAVTVESALQRSLNVPAVQVLEHLGSAEFVTRLQHAGLDTFGPGSRNPNSSVILGGIGVRMESLLGLFSALARDGQAQQPRLTPQSPVLNRYLMSPGAAWITREMLMQHPYRKPGSRSQAGWNLAWKTGTSYGYREAWALGVSPRWSIAVWVGRPDGSSSPGRFGRVTAAPLLFRIHALLGDREQFAAAPASVTQADICWPAGSRDSAPENVPPLAETAPENCLTRHQAYLLDETAPLTLLARPADGEVMRPETVWLDQNGLRAEPRCQRHSSGLTKHWFVRWPIAVEPWLETRKRNAQRLPPLSPDCALLHSAGGEPLQISSWEDGSHLRIPAAQAGQGLDVDLQARGGQGARDWYLNGRYIGSARNRLRHHLSQPGVYQISVVDETGATDMISIEVSEGS